MDGLEGVREGLGRREDWEGGIQKSKGGRDKEI